MYRQTHLEHKDKHKKTPLLTATASGSVKAMRALVASDDQIDADYDDEQYEAFISATDNRERNVIHLAVETGDVNVLKVRRTVVLSMIMVWYQFDITIFIVIQNCLDTELVCVFKYRYIDYHKVQYSNWRY